MSQVAVVLQARMGSRRLPGKSLAMIERRTILEHCVHRLRARSGMSVIVATTEHEEDDAVALEAIRCGAPVVRGPETDVLERFLIAAATHRLDVLIRATADNPAVDMDAPTRTFDLLTRTRAHHVVEHGLPYGCAVEAVDVAALREVAARTTLPSDREHVTAYFQRDRQFRALTALAPTAVRAPSLRMTVDTQSDLDFMRAVFGCVHGCQPAPLARLIAAAQMIGECQLLQGTDQ